MRTGQPLPAWSDDAIAALTRYAWPGNVRELANIVERLAILHPGRTVTDGRRRGVSAGRARRADADARRPPFPIPRRSTIRLSDTLDEYERVLISRALSMAAATWPKRRGG